MTPQLMKMLQITRMHSSMMRTACSSSSQGGVCLSACWGAPQVWACRCPPLGVGLETPPGVGLETPACLGVGLENPQPDPSTSPLGVGLETPPPPQTRPLNLPPGCGPGDLLQGMLEYNLLGYNPPPSPVNRITDTCKNITSPQLCCGR